MLNTQMKYSYFIAYLLQVQRLQILLVLLTVLTAVWSGF